MKKGVRSALWIIGTPLVLAALGIWGYGYYTTSAFDREMPPVWRAGFTEKKATVNGSVMNYAEGPKNGPALLLLHGQAVDWKNYRKVLPELSKHFHVYAVDYYGHGQSTRVPEKYRAVAIGRDLQQFIKQVIGEPVIVSGHSSGGLLSAWLGANAPAEVRGVVLEDPPLFTTLLPRAKKTWNYHDLATTTHHFLQQENSANGEKDFIIYNVAHSPMYQLFGGLQPRMLSDTRKQRQQHPTQPVKYTYMPPIMNEMLRGLNSYDPQFGEAFYTDNWDEGFDHTATLENINVPTVLIHTRMDYDQNSILRAAMDDQDAQRAASLLKRVHFVKVNTGHGFHDEKPRDFIQLLLDFKKRLN